MIDPRTAESVTAEIEDLQKRLANCRDAYETSERERKRLADLLHAINEKEVDGWYWSGDDIYWDVENFANACMIHIRADDLRTLFEFGQGVSQRALAKEMLGLLDAPSPGEMPDRMRPRLVHVLGGEPTLRPYWFVDDRPECPPGWTVRKLEDASPGWEGALGTMEEYVTFATGEGLNREVFPTRKEAMDYVWSFEKHHPDPWVTFANSETDRATRSLSIVAYAIESAIAARDENNPGGVDYWIEEARIASYKLRKKTDWTPMWYIAACLPEVPGEY